MGGLRPCAIALLLAVPRVALADPVVTCETTAECGVLHCIDGHCQSVPSMLWVPAHPSQKVGLVYAGSGTIVVGLGLGIASAALTASALETCMGLDCPLNPHDLLNASVPLGAIGLASVIGGIVMIVFGMHGQPAKLSLAPGGLRVTW